MKKALKSLSFSGIVVKKVLISLYATKAIGIKRAIIAAIELNSTTDAATVRFFIFFINLLT